MTYAYVVVQFDHGEFEKVDSVWTDPNRAAAYAINLKQDSHIATHIEKVRLLPNTGLPSPYSDLECYRKTKNPNNLADLLRATVNQLEWDI